MYAALLVAVGVLDKKDRSRADERDRKLHALAPLPVSRAPDVEKSVPTTAGGAVPGLGFKD